jgi:CRP/FNR family transcriptional regulator
VHGCGIPQGCVLLDATGRNEMNDSCRAAQWPQTGTDAHASIGRSARLGRFQRQADAARPHPVLRLCAPAPQPAREAPREAPADEAAQERGLFIEHLRAAARSANAGGTRLAVVVAQVAASSVGDCESTAAFPLQALLHALRQRLRRTDLVARLRANEFALLLQDAHSAERACSVLKALCEHPVSDEQGRAWRVSVTPGVAAHPAGATDAIGLLRCAGEAAGSRTAPATIGSSGEGIGTAVSARGSRPAALERLLDSAGMRRRVVHAGECVYRAGAPFRDVHVLNVGMCKLMMLSSNGHEELGSLLFKDDWFGLDGLDVGRYRYTAQAIDTGELWSVRYEALMHMAAGEPALLRAMHSAMVRQSSRDRDAVLAQHVLPADGKVADFLTRWADNLERSGLRGDQLVLPVTRAEIGAHLGLRLESVSRAISRLEREGLISFGPRNRREIQIPRLAALRDFVIQAEREA